MTMHYDTSNKTYLKKQMMINGYLMNSMQQIQKQLGSFQMNLSEYIDQQGQKRQFQFKLYDKNKKQTTLYFYMQFQRLDDDNQSVQSSQNQTVKSHKSNNVNNDKNIKNGVNNSQKSSQISSITKNMNQQSRKNSREYKQVKQYDVQQTPKRGKNDRQKPYQNGSNQTVDNKINQKYKPYQQPNIPKFKPPKNGMPKNSNQQPKKQQQSQQLKSYILQRTLRQKQKQIQKYKTQIKEQQFVIQALLQQKNKELGSRQVRAFNQQIQTLKKQLLQCNIRISELQSLTRNYQQNHQQLLKNIDTTTKKLNYYKQLAQNQKMKMAKIMQKCLQQGDNDLILFMQENILEQNDQ